MHFVSNVLNIVALLFTKNQFMYSNVKTKTNPMLLDFLHILKLFLDRIRFKLQNVEHTLVRFRNTHSVSIIYKHRADL